MRLTGKIESWKKSTIGFEGGYLETADLDFSLANGRLNNNSIFFFIGSDSGVYKIEWTMNCDGNKL